MADSDIANLVKTNIYTVPRYPEFPFLDPHWIKRANGETEIGPNAVPVDSPEAYDSFITDIPTVLSKITDIVTGSTKKLLLNTDFISIIIFGSVINCFRIDSVLLSPPQTASSPNSIRVSLR